MSAWTKFATNYYQEQKKKNPGYKFSDALKAAAKLYKKPAASSGSSGPSGSSEASEKENKDNNPISYYNSPEAWIQYIEEKNENKPLFEANPFWKDWVKTPSLALVPLDAVPPTLKPLFTTQNDKIFKSVAAFQKELDAFEQESRQTCVLSLQYLEWSWLFNFGSENWYNFTDSQNSIVVLNAKNGCGKSNFFETICLALFGEGFPSRDSAHSAAVLNNRWTSTASATGVAGNSINELRPRTTPSGIAQLWRWTQTSAGTLWQQL